MKMLKLSALAPVLLTLFAAPAQAAFVSSWLVTSDANFDTASIQPTSGITAVGTKTLNWGTPSSANSGIDISNSPITTTDTTNGAAQPNVSVTHRNNPITGTTLSAVNIIASLTLTPLSPAGASLGTFDLTFGVKYLETTNEPTNGVCDDGALRSAGGVNANGCADIFVIDKNALNFLFTYDSDGAGGDDPVDYYISFFEQSNGLKSLSSAACFSVTGSSAPCLGFETPEQATTTFRFASLITGQPVVIDVPEPGILGLFGLAFSVLGLGLRRKA